MTFARFLLHLFFGILFFLIGLLVFLAGFYATWPGNAWWLGIGIFNIFYSIKLISQGVGS